MTVMVDTGIFFAFYSLGDVHHRDSLAILVHLTEGNWGRAYITNHILDETLTILKYKISSDAAKAFVESFLDNNVLNVIYVSKEIELKALEIFMKNIERRGFSYTDAITMATIKELKIKYLLSFDIRSFQGLVKNIIGLNYWDMLSKDERKRILNLVREHLK